MVPPTQEEINRTREFKKTIAIVEFGERGSQIHGVSEAASVKLQSCIGSYFNFVVAPPVALPPSAEAVSPEQAQQLGKSLKVDYLLFANVNVFAPAPELRSSENRHKDKFYGSIWYEDRAVCELSMMIVDAATGTTFFSENKRGEATTRRDVRDFRDEGEFRRQLRDIAAVKIVANIMGSVRDLRRSESDALFEAVNGAAYQMGLSLRNRVPQTGQILQKISETEVLTNLGSAYGIKPGDMLIVLGKGASLMDPRTGLSAGPLPVKARLRVTGVTSGVSSTASAGAKEMMFVQAGDEVQTC
ncbi:MAG: hypothetical protein WCG06_01060 [Candidatus Omnitrophota bacterium]